MNLFARDSEPQRFLTAIIQRLRLRLRYYSRTQIETRIFGWQTENCLVWIFIPCTLTTAKRPCALPHKILPKILCPWPGMKNIRTCVHATNKKLLLTHKDCTHAKGKPYFMIICIWACTHLHMHWCTCIRITCAADTFTSHDCMSANRVIYN